MNIRYEIITYQEWYKQELIDMILNVYENELWFIGYERPDIYDVTTSYLYDPLNHFRVVIDERKELIWCFAIRKKNKKLAYLRRMILKKKFRRKGIWLKMLNTALTFAKKKWYKTIYAWTVKENTIAISFYKNHWFEEVDQAPKDITAAKNQICLKIDL